MEKIIEYTSENQVFWDWTEKKIAHNSEPIKAPDYFNQREIWWAALGKNVGSEIDGKSKTFTRPVLILKRYSSESCLVLPLTTQIKNNVHYLYNVFVENKHGAVVLSQPRTISSKRLLTKIEMMNKDDFKRIKNIFKQNFV